MTYKTMIKNMDISKALKTLLLSVFLIYFSDNILANNVTVYNISIVGQNTQEHFSLIQFSLSWDNSWRNDIIGAGYAEPYNWDAAWVFIKYRVNNGEWKHASLDNNDSFAPLGSSLDIGLLTPSQPFNVTSNPGLGTFIYRSENGIGNNDFQNVKVRWNYGVNGVGDNDLVDIKIFAIEVVNVPENPFYIGSGGVLERAQFYEYPSLNSSYYITSEDAITVGTNIGNLYYESYQSGGDQSGPVPQTFPKGYNQFYCMKYELSQQGYVDFLNSLSRLHQQPRISTSIPIGTTTITNRYVMTNTSTVLERNSISCNTSIPVSDPITFYCDLNENMISSEENDGQNIACNFVSWADVAAYLDWTALRPMTELEYEKICRGTLNPVEHEYAWGNNLITQNTGITFGGTNSEISSNDGNSTYLNHPSVQGPMRVGSFATSSSTRATSGASYYGAMEMSGNLYEHTVTIGNATGRNFTGIHGNGSLDSNGNQDVLNWPGIDAIGDGRRGGNWVTFLNNVLTSNRTYAALINAGRNTRYGIRGVRSVQ